MTGKADPRFFHLHLISDATGETLNTVARAATAHYADYRPIEHIYALVRTPKQLQRVSADIERQPGIVFFTIVNADLRRELEEHCATLGVPCISILDPVIESLARYLNTRSRPQVGGQHALNANYFRRIDALNFTMIHDDGQNTADIEHAEIVLVGISRTSKTPTSIYLAQRGFRTANIPIVPGTEIPRQVFELKSPLVVGLIASAERIAQIRRHRLLTLSENRETDYADPRHITQEILFMKKLCADQNWPMIDVTRRSVEETAASVLNLLTDRKAQSPEERT
ncbi:pyruvate, water dikinase regulatory protein [Aestuariivirga sp.]|uniref:pyruvate, water dikinase regulatory protein n=1 Tax=Aestuariivirga sp. TaxID=2650926 RepID=UPI0039E3F29C